MRVTAAVEVKAGHTDRREKLIYRGRPLADRDVQRRLAVR